VADPADDSVIVNNEDGMLYRWDLAHNTLAEKIRLNGPRPEAYTPPSSAPTALSTPSTMPPFTPSGASIVCPRHEAVDPAP
jgi:hypothetical protein